MGFHCTRVCLYLSFICKEGFEVLFVGYFKPTREIDVEVVDVLKN